MPRMVRILRNVEDVYVDDEGRLHIVLRAENRGRPRKDWVKQSKIDPLQKVTRRIYPTPIERKRRKNG